MSSRLTSLLHHLTTPKHQPQLKMTHHHHHHHHHNLPSLTFPIHRNRAIPRSGSQAYARAALKWKFGKTELSGYWCEHHHGGRKVFRKAISGSGSEGSKIAPTASVAASDGTEVPADSISNDLEYVVAVKIGTPGVTLMLDFDTGSSDLWVYSSELKNTSTGSHTVYNPSASSTAKLASGETWSISYGDGSSASGNVYNDTVTIGTISITSQAVELAEKISEQFVSSGSDGLLGLAWPSINTIQPTPQPTPVENMINQNLIPQPLFTVKLDTGDDNGFYSFGVIDENVTTDTIVYTPVDNSQGFWQFNSETAEVAGKTVKRSGNTAIADTGTTLCLLDDTMVSTIYGQISGAKNDSTQGGYIYPTSSTPPTVSLAVGNKLITINPEDFAYGPASDGYYFGGIQSRGTLGFDIFGDVWLKSAYVVFDQGNTRIGVAQRASTSSTTSS